MGIIEMTGLSTQEEWIDSHHPNTLQFTYDQYIHLHVCEKVKTWMNPWNKQTKYRSSNTMSFNRKGSSPVSCNSLIIFNVWAWYNWIVIVFGESAEVNAIAKIHSEIQHTWEINIVSYWMMKSMIQYLLNKINVYYPFVDFLEIQANIVTSIQ